MTLFWNYIWTQKRIILAAEFDTEHMTNDIIVGMKNPKLTFLWHFVVLWKRGGKDCGQKWEDVEISEIGMSDVKPTENQLELKNKEKKTSSYWFL